LAELENPAGPSGAPGGVDRLRASRDYRRVYRRGRRLHGRSAVLHVRSNDLGHPRLGFTAGRWIGGAVVRNRLRRRVREHYRQVVIRRGLPAMDVVVHLKAAASRTGRRAFYRELDGLYRAAARPAAGRRMRYRRRRRRRKAQ